MPGGCGRHRRRRELPPLPAWVRLRPEPGLVASSAFLSASAIVRVGGACAGAGHLADGPSPPFHPSFASPHAPSPPLPETSRGGTAKATMAPTMVMFTPPVNDVLARCSSCPCPSYLAFPLGPLCAALSGEHLPGSCPPEGSRWTSNTCRGGGGGARTGTQLGRDGLGRAPFFFESLWFAHGVRARCNTLHAATCCMAATAMLCERCRRALPRTPSPRGSLSCPPRRLPPWSFLRTPCWRLPSLPPSSEREHQVGCRCLPQITVGTHSARASVPSRLCVPSPRRLG